MSNTFHMTAVMLSGEKLEADTVLRDQIRYEDASRKGKWGALNENLLRFEAFMTWTALKRTKAIPDATTFDQFIDDVERIEADVVAARPTQPAASGGST